MRIKHNSIAMFAMMALCSFACVAQNEINGKINKVTVYPRSALVEKSIKVNLVKGENRFIIKGNASTFDENNLHFSQGDDFFVTSVSTKTREVTKQMAEKNTLSAPIYNKIRILEDSLDDVNVEIKNKNYLITTLQNQYNALFNLKAVKNTQVIDTLKTIKDQFQYQRDEGQKINVLMAQNKEELTRLSAIRTQLNDEIDDIINKNNDDGSIITKSKDILLTVYANHTINNVNIDYNYLVNNVESNYKYDVMLDESFSRAIFNLKTNVWQGTNENWSNCDIVFSTNDAANIEENEELNPYYLDFNEVRPMYKTANSRVMMMKATANNVEADEEVPGVAKAESMLSFSKAQTFTLSKEYTLNTKQTIASKNDNKSIMIASDTTKAMFKHFSTPKLNEKVFYEALLPNWEDMNLLETSCDVFLNGKYVANSSINTTTTKDTLYFSAGEDKNVKVSRKVTKSSPTKNSIFSSTVEEMVTVSIKLNNMKQTSIDLNLKDQVPISQNADLKVSDIKTDEGTLDANTGIISYNLTLTPKQEKVLTFSYIVKYPKGKRVTLN